VEKARSVRSGRQSIDEPANRHPRDTGDRNEENEDCRQLAVRGALTVSLDWQTSAELGFRGRPWFRYLSESLPQDGESLHALILKHGQEISNGPVRGARKWIRLLHEVDTA